MAAAVLFVSAAVRAAGGARHLLQEESIFIRSNTNQTVPVVDGPYQGGKAIIHVSSSTSGQKLQCLPKTQQGHSNQQTAGATDILRHDYLLVQCQPHMHMNGWLAAGMLVLWVGTPKFCSQSSLSADLHVVQQRVQSAQGMPFTHCAMLCLCAPCIPSGD
jgi:hypothetical protein